MQLSSLFIPPLPTFYYFIEAQLLIQITPSFSMHANAAFLHYALMKIFESLRSGFALLLTMVLDTALERSPEADGAVMPILSEATTNSGIHGRDLSSVTFGGIVTRVERVHLPLSLVQLVSGP